MVFNRFWTLFGCASIAAVLFTARPRAQSTSKPLVVHPQVNATQSGPQELELKGLKTSSDAIGVRVFVNPGPEGKLDEKSRSYLGSVYFSHQEDPDSKTKEGSFTIPIRGRLSGPVRVVISPISRNGSAVNADVEVKEARIKSADNSAFQ
jgi:hypothetical protein